MTLINYQLVNALVKLILSKLGTAEPAEIRGCLELTVMIMEDDDDLIR